MTSQKTCLKVWKILQESACVSNNLSLCPSNLLWKILKKSIKANISAWVIEGKYKLNLFYKNLKTEFDHDRYRASCFIFHFQPSQSISEWNSNHICFLKSEDQDCEWKVGLASFSSKKVSYLVRNLSLDKLTKNPA